MSYLHETLANGTIVDNRQYRYRAPTLSSPTWVAPREVRNGNKANSVSSALDFLRSAAERTAALDQSSQVIVVRPDGYEHNTDDPFLRLSAFGPDDFTLSTGNLVGCVTSRTTPQYLLNVSSRFGDDFLKYIVSDADGFAEIPDLGGHANGDLHWLLPYLWSVKMRKAWRLGLPKVYTSYVETTNRVRGRIDPLSHVEGEELARYRCGVREQNYDNPVTRLLAGTLNVLDTRVFLPEASLINRTLQAATHGVHRPIPELLAAPALRNPYFSDYNPLIALSKLILRERAATVGPRADTSALLFDVSMLFEYFVRKRLQRAGYAVHGKKTLQLTIPTGLASGRRRNLLPDLVIDFHGANHVFDVKYKSFDFRYGVAREDLFQLHTYVTQVAAHGPIGSCGLIYPVSEARWDEQQLARCNGIISDTFIQSSRDVPFHVIFLKIPVSDNERRVDGPTPFKERFDIVCQEWDANFRRTLQR
jgi:hypothetical protein